MTDFTKMSLIETPNPWDDPQRIKNRQKRLPGRAVGNVNTDNRTPPPPPVRTVPDDGSPLFSEEEDQ